MDRIGRGEKRRRGEERKGREEKRGERREEKRREGKKGKERNNRAVTCISMLLKNSIIQTKQNLEVI